MGMKASYLLLFLLIIASAFAQDIAGKIEEASGEVTDFLSGVPKEDILIVTGDRISMEDRMLFSLIKDQIDESRASRWRQISHRLF